MTSKELAIVIASDLLGINLVECECDSSFPIVDNSAIYDNNYLISIEKIADTDIYYILDAQSWEFICYVQEANNDSIS